MVWEPTRGPRDGFIHNPTHVIAQIVRRASPAEEKPPDCVSIDVAFTRDAASPRKITARMWRVRTPRSSSRRTMMRALCTLMFGGVIVACQAITGVDFDKAHLAETNTDGSAPRGFDASLGGDGGTTIDDAGNITSSCTPDPTATVCADKCETTNDNCNAPRACSTDCGDGRACNKGKCECVSNGQWCANRCGQTMDNCGRSVDCGGCDGGTCSPQGTCGGCVPQDTATACGGKKCGTVTNNCGQVVACGSSGQCSTPGALCKPDGSCCIDDGAACNGKCGGVSATNNCGQMIGCPAQCPAGQACVGQSCCIPEPASTTCAGVACGPKTNNCGQTITCPNTCAGNNTCGGGGAGPNGCGCTPVDPCGDRCSGTQVDNCGNTVTCHASCWDVCPCAGGTCSSLSHYCSCKSGPCL